MATIEDFGVSVWKHDIISMIKSDKHTCFFSHIKKISEKNSCNITAWTQGQTGLGVSPSGLGLIAQVHVTVSRATGFAWERRYILPCRIKCRYLCKTSLLTDSPCHSATAEARTNEGGGLASLNNDGKLHHRTHPKNTCGYFLAWLLCMAREGGPRGHLHGQTDTTTSKKGVWLQCVRANS